MKFLFQYSSISKDNINLDYLEDSLTETKIPSLQ